MDKILKILLEKGLKKKLEEQKRKKAEEDPEGLQRRRLIVIAVGLGLGAVAGLCVVKSLNALRKAQMEKAEREMSLDDDASPVIKLPDRSFPRTAPKKHPSRSPKPEPR